VTANLINQIMNDFRGGPISSIAAMLGESPAKTQTAMGGVLAALTGIIATKAATKNGATDLLDMIRRNGLDAGHYGDIAGAIAAPDGITKLASTGRPLLESLLGERTSSITEWVSSFGSIPRSAANSLLALALPLVLGTIGRRVSSSGGNVSSLMNLMSGQPFLQDAPAGLAAVLGVAEPAAQRPIVGTYDPEPRGAAARPVVGAYSSETRSGSTWWKWALPLLLLALLGYFLFRRPSRPVEVASVPTPSVEAKPEGLLPPASALGPFVDRTLQNSITITVPAEGIESKLVAFIEDSSRPVDKQTWFAFDRIEFDPDSATLRPSSGEQVRNIAEILRAYPNVNVKIGGYTDNVGDDARNLKLSTDRAANTMNAIAALGIDKSRLASEGYGKDHPVGDNATGEGRQRNRRIDIRVTKK
jgi:outer membrane protein OmpA-like peptidoglycan-associated protein